MAINPLNMQNILPKFPETHYGKINIIQKEDNELLMSQIINNDEVERNSNKVIKAKETSEMKKMEEQKMNQKKDSKDIMKKNLRMKKFDFQV